MRKKLHLRTGGESRSCVYFCLRVGGCVIRGEGSRSMRAACGDVMRSGSLSTPSTPSLSRLRFISLSLCPSFAAGFSISLSGVFFSFFDMFFFHFLSTVSVHPFFLCRFDLFVAVEFVELLGFSSLLTAFLSGSGFGSESNYHLLLFELLSRLVAFISIGTIVAIFLFRFARPFRFPFDSTAPPFALRTRPTPTQQFSLFDSLISFPLEPLRTPPPFFASGTFVSCSLVFSASLGSFFACPSSRMSSTEDSQVSSSSTANATASQTNPAVHSLSANATSLSFSRFFLNFFSLFLFLPLSRSFSLFLSLSRDFERPWEPGRIQPPVLVAKRTTSQCCLPRHGAQHSPFEQYYTYTLHLHNY